VVSDVPAVAVSDDAPPAMTLVADTPSPPAAPQTALVNQPSAVVPAETTTAIAAPPEPRTAPSHGITRPPRIIERPSLAVLRNPGPPGEVTVQVSVDATGAVDGVRTVSGPMALRATAEAAARQTRFEPALRVGVPVPGVVTVVYTISPR
jgi:TonB family protein